MVGVLVCVWLVFNFLVGFPHIYFSTRNSSIITITIRYYADHFPQLDKREITTTGHDFLFMYWNWHLRLGLGILAVINDFTRMSIQNAMVDSARLSSLFSYTQSFSYQDHYGICISFSHECR